MSLPGDYWESFEHRVASLTEYVDAVRVISAYQVATGTRFVWRGVLDATWALHSSLVRRYVDRHGRVPTECAGPGSPDTLGEQVDHAMSA